MACYIEASLNAVVNASSHRRRRRGGGGRGALCPPQKKKNRAKAVGNSGKSHGIFGQKPWDIRAKAMGNSGKSNGKFGKKQWEIQSGKSNHFCLKYYAAAFRVSLLLPKFSHCFCPNFPLVLPEFPIAFPEIRAKAIGN